jgi:hypothetical protein
VSTDSVQYRAFQDIQAAITGANLSTLNNDNVAMMNVSTDRGRTTEAGALPAVLICPLKETIAPAEGTTAQDDIYYPFHVCIVAALNQSQAMQAQYLNWRMNIRRMFHNQPFGPQTTESVQAIVVPGDPVDQGAFFKNLWSSWLIVRVRCREVRTQG